MSGNYGRLKPATKRHNANISMAYGCEKDPNTYCYRLTNGHKHLHRIILGRGWEHTPFDVTKLSCYEGKKGEESMRGRKAKEKPSDEALREFAEKYHHSNLVKHFKNEFHVGEPTARKWLEEAGLIQPKQAKTESEPIHCGTCKRMQKDCSTYCRIEGRYTNYEPQTPEPEGDQPDPAQSEASAPDIVPEAELQYTPTDNDYSDEPQRTTLTSSQCNALLNDTEEQQAALQIYLENQCFESLLKRWAGEVFEHTGLSIEKKLELARQLLEWRAGA